MYVIKWLHSCTDTAVSVQTRFPYLYGALFVIIFFKIIIYFLILNSRESLILCVVCTRFQVLSMPQNKCQKPFILFWKSIKRVFHSVKVVWFLFLVKVILWQDIVYKVSSLCSRNEPIISKIYFGTPGIILGGKKHVKIT